MVMASRWACGQGDPVRRAFKAKRTRAESGSRSLRRLVVIGVSYVFAFQHSGAVHAQVTLNDPNREITLKGAAEDNRTLLCRTTAAWSPYTSKGKLLLPKYFRYDEPKTRRIAARCCAVFRCTRIFTKRKLMAAGVGAKVAEAIGIWDLESKKLIHRWYPTKQLGEGWPQTSRSRLMGGGSLRLITGRTMVLARSS